MSGGDWFAPKRYGYGSGLPIAWQGWVVLIGYLVIVIGTFPALLPTRPILAITILVVATAALGYICATHTRGGWKWRSGGAD